MKLRGDVREPQGGRPARIDRLGAVYAAMATRAPVGLTAVAALAEELLEEARRGKPLRFVYAPVDSQTAYPGAVRFPPPVRFLADTLPPWA